MTKRILSIFSLFLLTSATAACSDDGGSEGTTNGETVGTGDGDGDQTGDGDGDQTGDGDGDGDPGDGDGDTGDGDGAFCAHQCTDDPDCMVGGQDVGLVCVDSFCTNETPQCSDNAECIALFSGWVTPCTAGGGECDAMMQICVPSGDAGLCATPPGDFIDCAMLQMEEYETTDIDGNDVTVCAQPSAECTDEGTCFLPCQSDDDCMGASAPICNVDTGLCECGQDSDCATLNLPHASVCNAGVCGCGSDQNCVDGEVGDLCMDGACGCSGDMACENFPNSFDGGSIACVEL